jgi:hypothetical protein
MTKLLLWLLEVTAEEVKGRTGTKAKVSGVYRSEKEYICLSVGERFPPTFNDEWVLVVSV